ncbi:MAG TPA: hypothetical protein VN380_19145 [Thermoanaerobaculia bacterium]|jgi:hypothetical protein|nr:hypothetical protein [Thermoanaerobaculia bacterium]
MKDPVWELNIRPMFRALDRRGMAFRTDLFSYDKVVELAKDPDADILSRVSSDMPLIDKGGPWPQEWVALFKRWMEGTPPFARLGLARGDYTAVRNGSNVVITAKVVRPSPKSWIWFQEDVDSLEPFAYALYLARGNDAPRDISTTVTDTIAIPQSVTGITMRDSEGTKTIRIT